MKCIKWRDDFLSHCICSAPTVSAFATGKGASITGVATINRSQPAAICCNIVWVAGKKCRSIFRNSESSLFPGGLCNRVIRVFFGLWGTPALKLSLHVSVYVLSLQNMVVTLTIPNAVMSKINILKKYMIPFIDFFSVCIYIYTIFINVASSVCSFCKIEIVWNRWDIFFILYSFQNPCFFVFVNKFYANTSVVLDYFRFDAKYAINYWMTYFHLKHSHMDICAVSCKHVFVLRSYSTNK